MRIMHFCCEYPPSGFGVGKYIGEISAGLRKLGHETVIVTTRVAGLPEVEDIERGRVYRIYDFADIGSPALAQRVLELASSHKVNLIESVDRLGEAAELLKIANRPPVLINCRYNDLVHQARYAQAWYKWQKLAIDLACLRERKRMKRERFCVENADLLAAPSKWMIDGLENQGLALPLHRAVLPKPLASLSGWVNREANKPTILLVARLDFGKGLLYLRDILARVTAAIPDVCLEIVGPDSYARFIGSVQKWTERDLGIHKQHVRFLGSLGRVELDEVYRRAWCVMIPSRWDTSPTVLLEAMVRSKPVVVSPFGGMAEYVGDGYEYVADPGCPEFADDILALLQDEGKRKAVGERLRRRAAVEYTPEHAAEAYAGFVSQIVSA